MNRNDVFEIFRFQPNSIRNGWLVLITTLGVLAYLALSLQVTTATGLTYNGAQYILIGIPLAALSVFVIVASEKLWVVAAIACRALILSASEDGIGVLEVLYMLTVLVGLAFWFFKHLFVYRKTLLRTGFDVLLLSFVGLVLILGLLMNVLYEASILEYFKEASLVFDLLLYFPIRSNINTKRDLLYCAVAYFVVILASGILVVVQYRTKLAKAVFQWQLTAARVHTGEHIYILCFIILVVLFVYSTKLRYTLFSMIGMLATLMFLALSFSRGPIIASLLGGVIILALVPVSKKLKLLAGMFSIFALAFGMVYFFMPSLAKNFNTALLSRIQTVSKVQTDLSLKARQIETGALLSKYIPESPILGHGFGVNYDKYDPIEKVTLKGSFIHNGYVYPLYTFGIPLTLLMLCLFAYPLIRIFVNSPRKEDVWLYAAKLGVIAWYVALMLVSYTSNQFRQYSGMFNHIVCWVILDLVNTQVIKRRQLRNTTPSL